VSLHLVEAVAHIFIESYARWLCHDPGLDSVYWNHDTACSSSRKWTQ